MSADRPDRSDFASDRYAAAQRRVLRDLSDSDLLLDIDEMPWADLARAQLTDAQMGRVVNAVIAAKIRFDLELGLQPTCRHPEQAMDTPECPPVQDIVRRLLLEMSVDRARQERLDRVAFDPDAVLAHRAATGVARAF